MADKYNPDKKDFTRRIISAYSNMLPTSEEPIYIEPEIFSTEDILPVEMIRNLTKF